jgi:hypothetical protein
MASASDISPVECGSASQDQLLEFKDQLVDQLIMDNLTLISDSNDAAAVTPENSAEQPTLPTDAASVANEVASAPVEGPGSPAGEAVPASHEDSTYKTYISRQLENLPCLGEHLTPVLESRYLQPVAKVADPYVQLGVQKAAPYLEGILSKTSAYVEGATPFVSEVKGKIVRVPAKAVETMKTTPAQLYHAVVNTILSTLQTAASVPNQVYHSAVNTACFAARRSRAVPGQVYKAAASTTKSITAAPIKLCQSTVEKVAPLGNSAVNFAQPVVHRTVGFIAPYVDHTLANQRVRALYQSRMIQAGIELASPYAKPVLAHPKIQAFSKPVLEWVCPPPNAK